jgi:hypothetical protein
MTKQRPILVGDKFKLGDRVVEVISTKPGGKVELFDRERAMFTDRWHRDVITLERVNA